MADSPDCFGFVLHFIIPFGNLDRLTWVRIQQPQEQRYPVLQVHAGSFRVSVIYRSLTWTTGSLTCVGDDSYACVYTRGLGTPTTSQYNIFYSEKLSNLFLMLLTGPGSNLRSLDLESDALPTEPPHQKLLTEEDDSLNKSVCVIARSASGGQGFTQCNCRGHNKYQTP